MSHLRPDQRFDWHGFVFAFKFLFFCAVAASFTHVGAQYVQGIAYASESKGPEVVVQRLRKYSGTLSTSTPQRIIRSLTTADVVPTTGKFIVADLSNMRVTLYDNGTSTAEYRIQTKGKPGTPWETPAGYYSIQTKEESHLSTIGHV
ncbi:L,D-transpeptidase, partial [Candidatus Kaiserbacteria bacterium]|nr:L,D-transpeptidase [Candidatus Kaiserbacteria bacterium]